MFIDSPVRLPMKTQVQTGIEFCIGRVILPLASDLKGRLL